MYNSTILITLQKCEDIRFFFYMYMYTNVENYNVYLGLHIHVCMEIILYANNSTDCLRVKHTANKNNERYKITS